jgi:hypothetical protein
MIATNYEIGFLNGCLPLSRIAIRVIIEKTLNAVLVLNLTAL